MQFLRPLTAGILSERRVLHPRGLEGGLSGKRGKNFLVRSFGSLSEQVIELGPKNTVRVEPGDAFVIFTPGGGGYGIPDQADRNESDDSDDEFKWA